MNLEYPAELATGFALVWVGVAFRSAGWTASATWWLGIVLIIATLITPNIGSAVQLFRDRSNRR